MVMFVVWKKFMKLWTVVVRAKHQLSSAKHETAGISPLPFPEWSFCHQKYRPVILGYVDFLFRSPVQGD